MGGMNVGRAVTGVGSSMEILTLSRFEETVGLRKRGVGGRTAANSSAKFLLNTAVSRSKEHTFNQRFMKRFHLFADEILMDFKTSSYNDNLILNRTFQPLYKFHSFLVSPL
jgi:hypothetical protein